MFRYNQKKVNQEVDELKKLLAITKGVKKERGSVSASFLKEELDLTTSSQESMPSEPMGAESPVGTDETKEIEKAIKNAKVTFVGPMSEEEDGEQVVKGVISNVDNDKAVYFQFSSGESKPKIQTSKAVVLDDDLLKSLEQISAYFDTWKEKTEK